MKWKSLARHVALITGLIVCAGVLGCSVIRPYRPTPEVKRTVVLVTTDYLTSVVKGDLNRLSQMIVWSEYLGDGSTRFTKAEFASQVLSLKNRWPLNDHPLIGLAVTGLDIDERRAVVDLQKPKTSSDERIRVELLWDGTAWYVTGDSLFGVNKRFSHLPPLDGRLQGASSVASPDNG